MNTYARRARVSKRTALQALRFFTYPAATPSVHRFSGSDRRFLLPFPVPAPLAPLLCDAAPLGSPALARPV
jgi:hypothetical protein